MKKITIILAVMMISAVTFAQETKPKFEKEGKMVKATYFHDNGEVAQSGYLKDGKLHGQWFMYDVDGKKLATGKYNEGVKEGKWLFWKGEMLKEVDFVDNRITNVKNWNQSEVVSIH
ncbi:MULTISPECIES: toxin-antitoxin system YwqK family antitoxin [Flavobacteriaceae]|uniref:toxin-antitoxin system YwqK family antitoxin n=1 Tax=Flavobacteriaceae TaxID=49546 RepID=UPI0010AE45CA|nr:MULTISPECIES: nicotinic acid mononucleotide adenyltransferase [Flavobacteriaceae]NJB36555.1 nicotinic acid mononucleotide adenyltransferase [Croceivirga sp. JEA036]TKD67292.1 nicotinic acid mononucleotide adenyltransferase [Flavobacterium sp. ASW18X]